jgi:CO dehydrogenase maturation factor
MKAIAISGKGGTGKTTVAALIIRWLRDNRSKSILAVDADPSLNLGDMLGVMPNETVGGLREEMRRKADGLPGGMTKQQFLEYKIRSSLTETGDFDLIAMGRPEGPGCYCYANNLLREILDTLSRGYDYVVIDNEAGMEHVSRRTTRSIDYLLMISDPTVRAVRTAGKINRLSEELTCDIAERYLVINKLRGSTPKHVTEAIKAEGLHHLASISEDNRLSSLDQTGEPTWSVLADTDAYKAVDLMMTAVAAEW